MNNNAGLFEEVMDCGCAVAFIVMIAGAVIFIAYIASNEVISANEYREVANITKEVKKRPDSKPHCKLLETIKEYSKDKILTHEYNTIQHMYRSLDDDCLIEESLKEIKGKE